MTAVINSYFEANSNAIEKAYTIEVVTFDGEREEVEVTAFNAEEAMNIACGIVENADYALILFAEAV